MITATRNFRVDDATYKPAVARAKKLGIPLTFVVRQALRDFVRKPNFTIGEPEEIEMPKEMHNLAAKMDKAADKFLAKNAIQNSFYRR